MQKLNLSRHLVVVKKNFNLLKFFISILKINKYFFWTVSYSTNFSLKYYLLSVLG